MAYCYMTRDAKCIVDNMARWALEARATITFWDGQVPKDAPGNRLQDVYEQQGMKPWLDWAILLKLSNWMTNQPDLQPDITVATVFGQRYTVRVVQLYLWEAQCKATVWLCEYGNIDWEGYLVQQTRPWVRLTRSPVVPLVCSRPLVGVKLPCLDGPCCHWMNGHIYDAGTMICPP